MPKHIGFYSQNHLTFSTKPRAICNFIIHKKQHLMGVWNQVAQYLYLKKKDPNTPNSQWVKYMHGINRISILLFLAGMIILAIKLLRN
jgi:hypothetical protein